MAGAGLDLSGLPPPLAAVVAKATDPVPRRRFGGGEELAAALDALLPAESQAPQRAEAWVKAASRSAAPLAKDPTLVGATLLRSPDGTMTSLQDSETPTLASEGPPQPTVRLRPPRSRRGLPQWAALLLLTLVAALLGRLRLALLARG